MDKHFRFMAGKIILALLLSIFTASAQPWAGMMSGYGSSSGVIKTPVPAIIYISWTNIIPGTIPTNQTLISDSTIPNGLNTGLTANGTNSYITNDAVGFFHSPPEIGGVVYSGSSNSFAMNMSVVGGISYYELYNDSGIGTNIITYGFVKFPACTSFSGLYDLIYEANVNGAHGIMQNDWTGINGLINIETDYGGLSHSTYVTIQTNAWIGFCEQIVWTAPSAGTTSIYFYNEPSGTVITNIYTNNISGSSFADFRMGQNETGDSPGSVFEFCNIVICSSTNNNVPFPFAP
jgi:hypothetical protein